jgi:hypothetical protein
LIPNPPGDRVRHADHQRYNHNL